MANIKILFEKNTILLASGFAKKASDASNPEFAELQRVKSLYPEFKTVVKHITKKPSKECYKGLTYEYMRNYIETHAGNKEMALAYFDELLLRAKCHSKGYRYPVIKKWFLDMYPQVDKIAESAKSIAGVDNFLIEEVA